MLTRLNQYAPQSFQSFGHNMFIPKQLAQHFIRTNTNNPHLFRNEIHLMMSEMIEELWGKTRYTSRNKSFLIGMNSL